MSRFERDKNRSADSPDDATPDAPAPTERLSDADESVAHIAALVRRTTERQGAPRVAPAPGPQATVAHPDATMAHPPPMTATQVAPPVPSPAVPSPVTPTATPPVSPEDTQEGAPESRRTMWPPSRRNLVIAGGLVLLLIGGGTALANWFGSNAPSPTASILKTDTPTDYAVKVTDVITDCAAHSRGKVLASFKAENCVKATRLLATGVVGGRPVLYVVSRVEMATSDAAASVKQVLDGNGTGNLNDLLREGKTYPGAPSEMPVSGYASVQNGTMVTVAEAGFVDDGRSSSDDPALRSSAAQVAAMTPTKG